MLMLSVESSATTASAALTQDDKVIKFKMVNDGKTHSEVLMPLIEYVMQGYTCQNLNAIAISTGPGSFTGVRIGVATVKGIAFANSIGCIGISTLEAIAHNFTDTNTVICAAMDARRNQFYTALFLSENGKIKRLSPDSALEYTKIEEQLSLLGGAQVIIAGDGAEKLSCLINVKGAGLAPKEKRFQNALGVARASAGRPVVDPVSLVPIYLRPSSAERNIRLKK
ncbi:MAG: tRNA (adenosine(37)-N6)-threonylcarbamoyltransferase complex dimerization subunit type 1 TsaB [Clostridiales bacterium]|nr:tRNA (adenosine(37)-N6)-threonylcarbamoyltransferase complex dimerization subunit type 1 TsaB [Clostridiales bacterium]